jgi:hypothetical protein
MHNNKHLPTSNAEVYGCKTDYTDLEDNDAMTPSGRKVYHMPLSILVVSSKISIYNLEVFKPT